MKKTPCLFARRRILFAAASLALPGHVAARARAAPVPDAALASASGPVLAPQLAAVYTGQIGPALCFISEKYDGVRALWDGRILRHRSGRTVSAPASFLSALPPLPLDGELWLGRGRFDALSAIVRRHEPRGSDWRQVRYMVFDTPVAGPSFAVRREQLLAIVPQLHAPVEIAPQWRGTDRADLERTLARTVGGGGEGLMLHVADAAYVAGRSDGLLKMKPHLDAEAVVVGYRAGAGKHGHRVGALEVESAEGRRFFIGSGLSDAARGDPPAVGTTVTYRYRDVTSSGLPRFATFVRHHEPD
ncbi:MAG: DNA ligase [Caldimonas sp.]